MNIELNPLTKRTSSMTQLLTKKLVIAIISTLAITACSSDSDEDGEGYLMIYNASQNAPELALEIEADGVTNYYSDIAYAEVAGTFSLVTDTYSIDLSIHTSNDVEKTVYQGDNTISNEDMSFLVLTGEIDQPELLSYTFELEDPETENEQFTLRFINLVESTEDTQIYMSLGSQTFEDALLTSSLRLEEMSDSHYFDVENYKFYIADATGNVIFESDKIPFLYTNQQLIIVKSDPKNDNGDVIIDRITTNGSVVTYNNIEAQTELRVFNAMDNNVLLPSYNGSLDFHLGGITDSPLFAALERHQYSDIQTLTYGDFRMDLTDPQSDVKLSSSQIMSLPSGSDKTVFFYLTEVEEADDGDDDTVEEIDLYVNSLIADNNTIEGYYHHEIQVVNFVEDFASVTVYFVAQNDTIANTEHKLVNTRAMTSTLVLPNDSYDVFIIAKEGSSDVLLANTSIELTSDSKNQFLVIEQEDEGLDDYTLTLFNQN